MWQLRSNDLRGERLLLEESLFSIGNGYIGVRGCFDEAPALIPNTIRGSYLNGYYDRVPVLYSESAYGFPTVQDKQPRIMDTQTSLIILDGEILVIETAKMYDYYRVLDLQKGLLERGYKYKTKNGKEAKLSFKRLASFTIKNLLCYEIDVEFDGEIEIISLLDSNVSNHSDASDPRVASGHEKLLNLHKMHTVDDLVFCEMETITSKLTLLCGIRYQLSSKVGAPCGLTHFMEEQEISTKAKGSKHLNLQKKCAFLDGIRSDNLYQEAMRIYAEYDSYSFDDLVRQQEAYLKSFWEASDIEIYGSDK
ncbi:MAG: glycoside hydrolase family 65, partial [Clostridia bacterium]|nr:glycoside hydrolase family 65 [Clostridia bacterium]